MQERLQFPILNSETKRSDIGSRSFYSSSKDHCEAAAFHFIQKRVNLYSQAAAPIHTGRSTKKCGLQLVKTLESKHASMTSGIVLLRKRLNAMPTLLLSQKFSVRPLTFLCIPISNQVRMRCVKF